jgi:HEAT repeat protein
MQHVFISYAHSDNDFAQLVRTELQAAEIQTWLAQESLKAGEDWREGIDDAIKESFAVIVIISPASDQSKYVTYEWALAYGLGIPIIPILYKSIALPQKPHPRLETLQYENFSSNINRPWRRLIERLHEIRVHAIEKEKRDPKIDEAIRALKDWDAPKIIRAADYLGRYKIQSAIPELERLLDDPDSELQIASIKALGKIGASQTVEKIVNFVGKHETCLDAIEALGNIGGNKAEEILIQQVHSDNCNEKSASIKALKNFSSPIVKKTLLELLKSSSYKCEDDWGEDEANVISSIFYVLSNRVVQNDVADLLSILEIDNNFILEETINLLGGLEDESSQIPLLKLTRHKLSRIRDKAFSALGNFKNLSDFDKNQNDLRNKDEADKQKAINYFYQNFGLDGLFYILSDPKGEAYWSIAKKIEDEVTEIDFPKIIDALQDSSERVRGILSEVVRKKNLTILGKELKPLIEDTSPFVCGLAIRAIGDLKYREAITQLKRQLKDNKLIFKNSNNKVCEFAAIALAKLGNKAAISILQELCLNADSSLQEEATALLIPFGNLIDKSLFESALYSANPNQSVSALKILGALEKNIDVTALIKELQENNSDEERHKAIHDLGTIYPPIGLIVTLAIKNIKSYWQIAEELQEIIQPQHVSIISQFLNDKHYRIRAFLAEIIGLKQDLNIDKQLIPLVDDESAFVRGLAIRALGRLKCGAAKDKIKAHLIDIDAIYSNSSIQVCNYSTIALINIGEQISSAQLFGVLKENPKYVSAHVNEIYELSPALINAELTSMLVNLLLTDEMLGDAATNIVQVIGDFGSPANAHTLLDFLSTSNYEYWYVVKDAVIKLADETIKSKALFLLNIDKKNLRMACLDILEEYGDETIVDKLLDLLDTENDPRVILRIITVVAIFGTLETLERLIPFITSEHEFVRRSVVKAFGKLRDTNSISRIIPFLDDETYVVRDGAIEALIDVGDPTIINLIIEKVKSWENEELKNADDSYFYEESYIHFLEAIGKLGTTSHIPMLQHIAQNHKEPTCRAAAIIALEKLGGLKTSIDILIEKLTDKEYSHFHEELVCNIAAEKLNLIRSRKSIKALNNWLSNLPDDEKPSIALNPN